MKDATVTLSGGNGNDCIEWVFDDARICIATGDPIDDTTTYFYTAYDRGDETEGSHGGLIDADDWRHFAHAILKMIGDEA